jgi:signal transduction histidine kinase
LKVDGPAQESVFPAGTGGYKQIVRGIARRLPNGDVVVVGRNIAGDLRERLPARGGDDPFDKLAVIVNGMLANIETLIHEIAGVGDDIAQDLRTPLTRVRVRLERGCARSTTLEELKTVVDQAIGGLDQSLAIITALLRIAEIEHVRRLVAKFHSRLCCEVGELYEPIAEDKHVTLRVDAADDAVVRGDRDLLFEAIANLVDNAVRFTPAGGHVELYLLQREGEAAIRVKDTGPGISESDSKAVTKRFLPFGQEPQQRRAWARFESGRCNRQTAQLSLDHHLGEGVHRGNSLPAAA